ncbi:uncharacterized protein LOC141878991 [Acropora palmata]|uniref:uncharacterized protein LOC141878991 n=1 Tax=Acropora palmata TaxID=6131 RepID=UPI003DA13640
MVKTHNCLVEIENKTIFPMTYVREWYSSGRVADGFTWTDVASAGHLKVNNYERDAALAGCSGYVTYQIAGTEFSIAFSNPSVGKNKLGVGLDGIRTWENMSYHSYERFVQDVDLGGVILVCTCQCTGGDTNHCVVEVDSQWSSSTSSTPALLVAPPN